MKITYLMLFAYVHMFVCVWVWVHVFRKHILTHTYILRVWSLICFWLFSYLWSYFLFGVAFGVLPIHPWWHDFRRRSRKQMASPRPLLIQWLVTGFQTLLGYICNCLYFVNMSSFVKVEIWVSNVRCMLVNYQLTQIIHAYLSIYICVCACTQGIRYTPFVLTGWFQVSIYFSLPPSSRP